MCESFFTVEEVRARGREEIEKIRAIADRVKRTLFYEEDEDKYDCRDLEGRCKYASDRLWHELMDNDYSPVFVCRGTYHDIPNDFQPDTSQWSDEDIEDWEHSVEEGGPHMLHYWVKVYGFIVDITADQFHVKNPEDYWVVVEPDGHSSYVEEDARSKMQWTH
jgi:hypothetical protein